MANFTELISIGRSQEDNTYFGTWFPFQDDDDDCGGDTRSFWNSAHREQLSVDGRFIDVGKLSFQQQQPLMVVPNVWAELSRNGQDGKLLESGPTSAGSWSASDVCSVDSIGKIRSNIVFNRYAEVAFRRLHVLTFSVLIRQCNVPCK